MLEFSNGGFGICEANRDSKSSIPDEIAMQIRLYAAGDLPHIKELTVAGFAGVSIDHGIEQAFGPINGHDWRWRKARHIDDDIARDAAGVFVAEDGGQIVGYVTTWQDRDGGIGHIPNLAVAVSHRNQGLGRLLLERALDHFRGWLDACQDRNARSKRDRQSPLSVARLHRGRPAGPLRGEVVTRLSRDGRAGRFAEKGSRSLRFAAALRWHDDTRCSNAVLRASRGKRQPRFEPRARLKAGGA